MDQYADVYQWIVQADRSGGHTKYWTDDFQRFAKTLNQGVSTHVFAAFHDSISSTGTTSLHPEN